MPAISDLLSASALLILAPLVGSFLGTLIARLPKDRPVVLGRSRCEACGQALGLRPGHPHS